MENSADKVYKYLPRNFALSMLEKGQIKIGTLFSYRKDEIKAREDQGEGTKTLFAKEQTYKTEEIPERLLTDKIVKIEGNGNLTFSNYIVGVPDAYIYCVSRNISHEIMTSFTDCDTIVEISDYKFVFQNLSRAFHTEGIIEDHYAIFDCDYSGRKYDGDNKNGNPYCLKDPIYAYQEETRLILLPKTKPIEPLIVEVPDLIPYLKIITL